MAQTVLNLATVEAALNRFLRPKIFAEKWDNVGLLVGSGFYPKDEKLIDGILVCNDLTPEVVEEANERFANLIVAYHPPIFSPLKAVAYGSWKETVIARCLALDISVYSPHTTLDCIAGGINDAVIDALYDFGSADCPTPSFPIIPTPLFEKPVRGLVYTSSVPNISALYHILPWDDLPNIAVAIDSKLDDPFASLSVYSTALESGSGIETIKTLAAGMNISEFKKPSDGPPAPFGSGRKVTFTDPAKFQEVVMAIKKHLKLDYVQIGFGGKFVVESAAVCVGSGASLLKDVPADVYITGEMSHHDILDCVQAERSVIICGHYDSEKHYLPKLASIVGIITQCENVMVSKADKSPVKLMVDLNESLT